jgi:hypothetical protein
MLLQHRALTAPCSYSTMLLQHRALTAPCSYSTVLCARCSACPPASPPPRTRTRIRPLAPVLRARSCSHRLAFSHTPSIPYLSLSPRRWCSRFMIRSLFLMLSLVFLPLLSRFHPSLVSFINTSRATGHSKLARSLYLLEVSSTRALTLLPARSRTHSRALANAVFRQAGRCECRAI